MDRFRVASTLARKLEEVGVSPADVLRQVALPTGLLAQERILVSTEELFALYRGLADASRDPAIGLELGAEPRSSRPNCRRRVPRERLASGSRAS